jgi:PAS domain-containing protein
LPNVALELLVAPSIAVVMFSVQPMSTSDAILKAALILMRTGSADMSAALDSLPEPIYVTDASGRLTYFNKYCVDFAGRNPVVGSDRWCVTWRLYTPDGDFLPHDQCPMAVAIRNKSPIRDVTAVAERPDGQRILFRPFPTPILDNEGDVISAINMLIDVSDNRRIADYRASAERCRRLALRAEDQKVVDQLNLMAADYAAKVSKLLSHSQA